MQYQITYFERDGNLCEIEIDREFPFYNSRLLLLSKYSPQLRKKESKLPGKALYTDLAGTDGVVRLRTDRYILRVYKATPFAWADVLPGILYVLNTHLAPEEEMQAVTSPRTVPLDRWDRMERDRVKDGNS